jgi:hypothetical protein
VTAMVGQFGDPIRPAGSCKRAWLSPLKALPRGKVLLVAGAEFSFDSQGVQLRSQTYKIVIELVPKSLDRQNDLRAVAFNQAESELCQH